MLDTILERWNLRRAFERVRENGGCRGADGMTLGQFAGDLERELDRLQDRLLRRVYHPYPLLQFTVPKRSGGTRFLCVPTVRDRVAQTAVDLIVRPVFEAEFEDSSYADRLPGATPRAEVGSRHTIPFPNPRRLAFYWLRRSSKPPTLAHRTSLC